MSEGQLLRAVTEAVIRLSDEVRELRWDNRHILVGGEDEQQRRVNNLGRMQIELSNALLELGPR